jgi:hypothetical protein
MTIKKIITTILLLIASWSFAHADDAEKEIPGSITEMRLITRPAGPPPANETWYSAWRGEIAAAMKKEGGAKQTYFQQGTMITLKPGEIKPITVYQSEPWITPDYKITASAFQSSITCDDAPNSAEYNNPTWKCAVALTIEDLKTKKVSIVKPSEKICIIDPSDGNQNYAKILPDKRTIIFGAYQGKKVYPGCAIFITY